MGLTIGPRTLPEDIPLAVIHHFRAPFQRRYCIQRRKINKRAIQAISVR
jgi:hypothetical protein